MKMLSFLALSVTNNLHRVVLSINMFNQFIKILSFVVLSVTKNLLRRLISDNMLKQFMKRLSFLALNVTNNFQFCPLVVWVIYHNGELVS